MWRCCRAHHLAGTERQRRCRCARRGQVRGYSNAWRLVQLAGHSGAIAAHRAAGGPRRRAPRSAPRRTTGRGETKRRPRARRRPGAARRLRSRPHEPRLARRRGRRRGRACSWRRTCRRRARPSCRTPQGRCRRRRGAAVPSACLGPARAATSLRMARKWTARDRRWSAAACWLSGRAPCVGSAGATSQSGERQPCGLRGHAHALRVAPAAAAHGADSGATS